MLEKRSSKAQRTVWLRSGWQLGGSTEGLGLCNHSGLCRRLAFPAWCLIFSHILWGYHIYACVRPRMSAVTMEEGGEVGRPWTSCIRKRLLKPMHHLEFKFQYFSSKASTQCLRDIISFSSPNSYSEFRSLPSEHQFHHTGSWNPPSLFWAM